VEHIDAAFAEAEQIGVHECDADRPRSPHDLFHVTATAVDADIHT